MPSSPSSFVTPELFRFLRQLARNNNRDWFADNKQRYHDVVRDPLCMFVEAVGPKLRKLCPSVIADSRPVGGSLFRIYRDTRFATDKSPYKTTAALGFRTANKDVAAPTFYLSLQPGTVFAGTGLWHPDPGSLRTIREAIVAHPTQWKRAKKIGLAGAPELKRAPRGFDPDHPLLEDLKRKSFYTSTEFTEEQTCSSGFLDRYVRACRMGMPLVSFLGGSLRS
jgi:uncharacterized protein (TIGR02453 family)